MKVIKIIILCLLPWCGTISRAYTPQSPLSDETYPDIRNLSLELLKNCADDCQMVGLGRNPTPFLTFVNLYRPGRALQLPLSEFRPHPYRSVDYGTWKITPGERRLLRHYMDQYFRPLLRPQVKRLMLLDYCKSGASLFSFTFFAREFLERENRRDIEIIPLAIRDPFSRDQYEHTLPQYPIKPPIVVNLNGRSRLAMQMAEEIYDDYAPVGFYPAMTALAWPMREFARYALSAGLWPNLTPPLADNSLKHQILVEDMRFFMEQDTALKRVKPRHCPDLLML
jgi:hypothetical protein